LLFRLDVSLDLVVCGHVNLLGPAWILACLTNSHLALIIHGIDAWQPSESILNNWLAGRVDSLISVSQLSADRFCRWSRTPKDKISNIPNCVDLSLFQPASRDPTLVARYGLGKRRVIMTVGRLAEKERYKGFDEVINVLPRLVTLFPDIAYLIVGGGKDQDRLQDKVKLLELDRVVTFTGQISEAEKAAHYSLADLYVMPSSGEGFGIVYLEAAACGIPIIGSKIDGSREALRDGMLGVLVDPTNEEEVFESIKSKLNKTAIRQRPLGICYFSEAHFRERVNMWINRVLSSRTCRS